MISHESIPHPKSCDTFVALPPATANGCVIFGKNSDRPGSEVQEVIHVAAADHPAGAKVQCTYIEIEQVGHTHGVVLSRPAWMWGAEMGANDKGVCVGNEAVWTQLNGPQDLEERLLGMDMVRLALERASTASEAVDVIGQLVTSIGQGGPCSDEPGQQNWSYHNSFLIADPTSAWVLETAGAHWSAEHVTEGVRNISNELSIGTKIDRSSPNLIAEAKSLGLFKDEQKPFDFAAVFSEGGKTLTSQKSCRYRYGLKMLKELSASGKFGAGDMMKILRDEESGICMTGGSFVSQGSQVSVLVPPSSSPAPPPCVHWLTATPNPLTSIYKPFVFAPGTDIGTATVSPQFGDADPAKVKPRFQTQVDRRHPLYKGHESLRELVGKEDAKGMALLAQLRELEGKCLEDMADLMDNFSEPALMRVACIFKHMADIELNFYK